MNDDVLDTVRDSLSAVHMHTPVEAIVASGRARRRRRLSGLAALGALAALGLALGIPALDRPDPAPPQAGGHPVQLAAFSVISNPNGTATVTLAKGPGLNPDALGQALTGAGIPALIKVGEFCRPENGKVPGLGDVLSSERRADGTVVLVIDPAALPQGAKLSIGFKPDSVPGTKDRIRFTLVAAGAPVNCSSFR